MNISALEALFGKITMISENPRTTVYHAISKSAGIPFILKTPTNPRPTPSDDAYLSKEFGLLQEINSPKIPKAIELIFIDKRPVMVIENFPGITLEALVKDGPLPLDKFFPIALQLVELLGELHGRNIMHKDIHPGNILIDPLSEQVTLIDYGLSTKLDREHSFNQNSNVLLGTLKYMSPEQTGRMNRFTDYRTDMYSLGLCFYKLLVAKDPFPSEDPMELVHCHIAKNIDTEPLLTAGIPTVLISILEKLTSKMADERYQSLTGLMADLDICSKKWSESEKIEEFILGSKDISLKFRVPDRLFGRSTEVAKLLDYHEAVWRGQSHVLFVDGLSGIGKTALIHEVHKPTVQKNGYFITGKFDQFKNNLPFYGFSKAFSELVKLVVSEPTAKVDAYKLRLKEVLGFNLSVLKDLVPDLSLILDQYEGLYALNLTESQNRFFFAIKDFLRVFATKEHPLTIFLDDLQWCDEASLNLIKELAQRKIPHLLIICAYRTNELTHLHPLKQSISSLMNSEKIHEIHLEPLGLDAVVEIVSHVTFQDSEAVLPLAKIVYKHTGGNPFFIQEFLKNIYAKGLLNVDLGTGKWVYDLNKVSAFELSSNVIEMIGQRVNELPATCKKVVEIASCIGFQFDLKSLAIITQRTSAEVGELLWPAVKDEIIIPLDENYALLASSGGVGVTYVFQHDKIHQAVYQQLDAQVKTELHYSIGKLLLGNSELEYHDEQVIEIVRHLNESISLIQDQEEMYQLARLNARAGLKAQTSVAYAAAREYFLTGIKLLSADGWKLDYDLAFNLYFGYAQNAYQTGLFEDAESYMDQLLANAGTKLDHVKILSMRLRQFTTLGKTEEAIAQGIEGLAILGIMVPLWPNKLHVIKEVIKAKWAMRGKDPKALLEDQEMIDPEMRAASRLLTEIGPAAYTLGNDNLYALTNLKLVNLSLKHGNCAESSFAYTTFGAILGEAFGDYEGAEKFGQLALALNDRLGNIEYKCRVLAGYGTLLHHFNRHWNETTAWFKRGVDAGYQSGDIFFLAYSANATCFWDPQLELSASVKEQKEYLKLIEEVRYEDAANIKQMYIQFAQNLQGKTLHRLSMNGDGFLENKCLSSMQDRRFYTGMATYYILKANIYLHYHRFEESRLYIQKASEYRNSLLSNAFLVHLCKVGFFASAGLLTKSRGIKRLGLMKEMQKHYKTMKKWAAYNPINFNHIKVLMQAELSRSLGNSEKAARCFEKAIEEAKKNKWLNDCALANELAARHYFEIEHNQVGVVFLRQAIDAYAEWGASEKIVFLKETYGDIPEVQPILARYETIEVANTLGSYNPVNLDISAIIKASQVISGEIVFDSLLKKMIEIITMNAGGERGMILIANETNLFLQASYEDGMIKTMQNVPLEECQLPMSVINYVTHLKESLVLNDASKEGEFTRDEFIKAHEVKSILCSPILLLSKLYGVIYLENNKITGAFTKERLMVLNLLSTQVAISIQNAMLYSSLEQKVAYRTAELTQSLETLKSTQSQLLQAEKMASLGQLTAGIAHEIQNPLNFVINFSEVSSELIDEMKQELIQKATDDALAISQDIQENLKKINFHGKRADAIVKGMLQHSRTGTGQMELTDINLLADEFLRLSYHGLRAKDKSFQADFKMELDPELPQIFVVPQDIGRVLLNLINNAFYAVNSKKTKNLDVDYKPLVTLKTEHVDEGVRITVSDNGIGMPEDLKTKVFEPFFTTKPTGEGTGLGLSISYDIIKSHGGEIHITSVENEGTKFNIFLPSSIV
jgi:histidine kinase